MARPYVLIPIPAGSVARKCNGARCTALIYDVPRPSFPRQTTPVHVAPELHVMCEHPTATVRGLGINHFIDCPDAAKFTKRTLRGSR